VSSASQALVDPPKRGVELTGIEPVTERHRATGVTIFHHESQSFTTGCISFGRSNSRVTPRDRLLPPKSIEPLNHRREIERRRIGA